MATLPGTPRLRARPLQPAALGLLLLTAACHLDRSPIVPDDAGVRAAGPVGQAGSATRVESGGTGGSVQALTPRAGEVASVPVRVVPTAPTVTTAAGAPAAQAGADVAAASPARLQPSAAAGKPAPTPVAGSGGALASAAEGGGGAASSKARRCVPGPYSGTFEGSVQLAQLSEFSRVTGSLTGELTPDGAEGLVLKKGELRGTDQDQNTLVAAFTGRFSCITHRLENGKIEDGVYHLAALNMDVAFSGSAGGTQSDEPPSASGSWITASSDGLLRGSGTWSLREGKN